MYSTANDTQTANDPQNTSKLLDFHSFADDTNMYCSLKNLNDLELILNQELHAVAEGMKCNRLALSILKTNFVLFHFKKLKPYKSLDLKIDGVNNQEVSTVNTGIRSMESYVMIHVMMS